MVVLLSLWPPSNAAPADDQFAKSSVAIRDLKDHAVFLAAQWMARDIDSDCLCHRCSLSASVPLRMKISSTNEGPVKLTQGRWSNIRRGTADGCARTKGRRGWRDRHPCGGQRSPRRL